MRHPLPAILIGVLLLALGAVVAFVVRDTRATELTPLERDRAEAPRSPEELVRAEGLEQGEALDGRVEEEPPHGTAPVPPAVQAGAEPALPFRGQVVDVATGEPVAFATLVAGRDETPVGPNGRWAFEGPLPAARETIEFHNRVQGTHIRSVRRQDLERVGEEWLARIAIGPTYRLRILDSTETTKPGWRARLVELLEDGSESRGSWIKLYPSVDAQPPFFRYDNPWEPDATGSSFRIDVRSAGSTLAGSSGRIASAVGIYPELVTVRIDRSLARAYGRVVNVAEQPVQRARVVLVPVSSTGAAEEAESWPTDHTEGDGTYQFQGLTPGIYRVHVRPRRGETPQSRTEELQPGDNRLEDFVFAVQEGAGMIEGKLVSRRGQDFEHKEIVRLRAVDGRDFELLDISSDGGRIQAPFRRNVREYGEEGEHVFEFNEVPAGQYELSVVAQDGYAWTPTTAAAEPPNDELVFYREDDIPHRSYTFEVFDEKTGERIERFTVQHQIGSTWNAEARELVQGDSLGPFPAGTPFTYAVHAPGYAPAWGNQKDFGVTGETRVELQPGWGIRLFLRDLGAGLDSDDEDGRLAAASRPPVPDAEVWIDGRRGTAGANGDFAATGAPGTEPERITIRAPGWRVVGSERFRDGRIHGRARDVVVWMTRE